MEQHIPMQSLGQAQQELQNHKQRHQNQPWQISSEINNLFAKLMAEDSAEAIEFRDHYADGRKPETTKLMCLQASWQSLFPGRYIAFQGYTPKVTSEYVAGEMAYAAQSMSDGERVALYLAGRVLDAGPGIVLIDEPEVHFHSRLAIQFWDELERLRPDCRFIYITHDLPFARSRNADGYVIVRPGVEPQILSVDDCIPSDVIEEILAAASFSIYARRIIFCEGTEASYDQLFLRAWFYDRFDAVIPVGSCGDVVKCVAAFTNTDLINGMSAIGIVDRDYWPDQYLESLPTNITVLLAHEIESLFCVKAVACAIAIHLGKSEAQATILYEEFLNEAVSQFSGALFLKQVSERFRLRCVDQINRSMNALRVTSDEEYVKLNHCEALAPERWNISPMTIFEEERATIMAAINDPKNGLTKMLPGKVYFGSLVRKLGLDKKAYVELLSNSLKSKVGDPLHSLGTKIRCALSSHLPNGQSGR
ncbi:AAA family ATPase [Deltaproteobacteria bacterium TL4]